MELTIDPRLYSHTDITSSQSAMIGLTVPAISSPAAAMVARPATITGLGENFSIRLPDMIRAPAISSEPGRNNSPTVCGDSASTLLPYCPRTMLSPAIRKLSVKAAASATVNVRLPNSDRSSVGSGVRRSCRTKSTAPTTLTSSGSQAWGRRTPFWAAASPMTRVRSATPIRTMPITSSFARS